MARAGGIESRESREPQPQTWIPIAASAGNGLREKQKSKVRRLEGAHTCCGPIRARKDWSAGRKEEGAAICKGPGCGFVLCAVCASGQTSGVANETRIHFPNSSVDG